MRLRSHCIILIFTMKHTLLLLELMAMLSSLLHAELHPELREYEVVRPERLHTQHRRHAESSHTDSHSVSYRLQLKGKTVDLHLSRSRSLLSPTYTETHYTPNGTRVTTSTQDLQVEHECYYLGSVGDAQQSAVSISTCHGLRGFFSTEDEDYMIEPLTDSPAGDHAVFKAEFFKNQHIYCGVSNVSINSALPIFNTRGHRQSVFAISSDNIMEDEKYIEAYLVVDHSEFKKLGSDLIQVRKRMFEIVNFVNMVYLPLNTFIGLVGLEVWTDGDKIDVGTSAGHTLSAFNTWRSNDLNKIKKNDNAQLITAIDFGTIAGLAFVGSLCTSDSTTLVRDFSPNALETGAVLAHELGHNLGMKHDSAGCSCVDAECIMSPTLRLPPPQHFSNCSVAEYLEFLQSSPAMQCLLNKPDDSSVITPPVCGNGFLEEGEECDCGTVQECTDPCCHAATCTFTKGSQCSTGDCCDNCKFLPLATMCRDVESECDLPEYCTGVSAECPVDTFRVNGISCRNDSGYCYNGQCPLLLDQCMNMWGDAAEVASDSCYNLNVRGTHYGYCTRPYQHDYIGCKQKDIMCGRLFCSNGTAQPQYGTGVTVNSCRTTVYQDPATDFGQVQTGTKCGEGQVCSDSACVEIEPLYHAPICATKCSRHAVCNNVAECQCVPGWVPPDCVDRYTYHIVYAHNAEGSVGLGTGGYIAIGVCLAVMLAVMFVAVMVVAVWKMRQQKQQRRDAESNGGTSQHEPTHV